MRIALLAAISWFVAASPVAAAVSVEFVAPGSYTDANLEGRYRGPASPSVLRDIETHLVQLGRLYLSPDESLTIQILDIDLAGEIESQREGLYARRVLRPATWPRINLRYVLSKQGKVLREAQEVVTDPGYLGFGSAVPPGGLFHEKRMLDDWFRRRFAR
jgi:hypothetical protein